MGVAPSNLPENSFSTATATAQAQAQQARPQTPHPPPVIGENQGTAGGKVEDWWNKDGKVVGIQDAKDWNDKSKCFKNANCNTLVVVEFHAAWSGPSRFIYQFIEKLAAANKDVLFLRLNYDSMEQVAADEGVDVVPTFVLYKGGAFKDKIVGAKRFELSTRIDQLKQQEGI